MDAQEIYPFPFASVEELRLRWPDLPVGSDERALALLEDASQFIVDVVPAAAAASELTRRRVACDVVRRRMSAETAALSGFSQVNETAGGVTLGGTVSNPAGDFYLTAQEKKALGAGRQSAFSVPLHSGEQIRHRPWCNLLWGALYCSCGADIAGAPIYEAGV